MVYGAIKAEGPRDAGAAAATGAGAAAATGRSGMWECKGLRESIDATEFLEAPRTVYWSWDHGLKKHGLYGNVDITLVIFGLYFSRHHHQTHRALRRWHALPRWACCSDAKCCFAIRWRARCAGPHSGPSRSPAVAPWLARPPPLPRVPAARAVPASGCLGSGSSRRCCSRASRPRPRATATSTAILT